MNRITYTFFYMQIQLLSEYVIVPSSEIQYLLLIFFQSYLLHKVTDDKHRKKSKKPLEKT